MFFTCSILGKSENLLGTKHIPQPSILSSTFLSFFFFLLSTFLDTNLSPACKSSSNKIKC